MKQRKSKPAGQHRKTKLELEREVSRLRRRVQELETLVDSDAPRLAPTKPPPAGPDAEEKYRALFEYAPIGLGVADVEGNLLTFNDAILAPGGYNREDVVKLGNVARLYCHPADRERVLSVAKRQGFVWRHEVQFRRKDGTCYDTLLSLTPVRFAGQQCWHAMVENITDQKRAEEERRKLEGQLRQAQKMEAVGRMTGGIAHDFNNLLSIIMTNAELIVQALGPDDAVIRRDLDELRAAADRGAGMIRKLLGFSRTADLNVEPTDVGDLVQRLKGMLRHTIPEHIALEVTAAAGCTADVDPGAVEQMVLNLASNARDAIAGTGIVRISVGPILLAREQQGLRSWMTPGEFVRISVSDNGSGMDAATRSRALEPFFTTKPAGLGTGLGLSMVYGLVKQQGGFIDVESEVGKGTTVRLYFPKGEAQPKTRTESPASGNAKPGGATILLLEDDDGLRRTAKRVLEHLGYAVLVAPDGQEGLALYRARRDEIDLVISDMVMPGLTGLEVYEAIRRSDPQVLFLLSSGYQARDLATAQLPAGLRLFRKPWTLEELATQVEEVLRERA